MAVFLFCGPDQARKRHAAPGGSPTNMAERHRKAATGDPASRTPGRLIGATVLAFAAFALQPAGAGVQDLLEQARWGASSQTLVRTFGDRATVLDAPIRFGDSYVDLVLNDEQVGGYAFKVYFQMDRERGGLKRIHLERPHHGAVAGVFRSVLDELEAAYGPPSRVCAVPPTDARGYQRAETVLWQADDGAIVRATFRDTTLGALESCLGRSVPCRLTARLFLQLGPPGAIPEPCG